jgi:hypothetical protein
MSGIDGLTRKSEATRAKFAAELGRLKSGVHADNSANQIQRIQTLEKQIEHVDRYVAFRRDMALNGRSEIDPIKLSKGMV